MGALQGSYNPWYLTESGASVQQSYWQRLKTTESIKRRLLVYSVWIDLKDSGDWTGKVQYTEFLKLSLAVSTTMNADEVSSLLWLLDVPGTVSPTKTMLFHGTFHLAHIKTSLSTPTLQLCGSELTLHYI